MADAGAEDRIRWWDLGHDRVWTFAPRWYLGAAFIPFQVAFGVSLRWHFGQPHARLYFWHFKFYLGRKNVATDPIYSGGDR